jgi:hypothetical protein
MKMSVVEFGVPPAIVGRSRSVWHEIIDTVRHTLARAKRPLARTPRG